MLLVESSKFVIAPEAQNGKSPDQYASRRVVSPQNQRRYSSNLLKRSRDTEVGNLFAL